MKILHVSTRCFVWLRAFSLQSSAFSLQPYLVLALALCWCCSSALAIDHGNLRFYLPFEGSLQPHVAAANTQLKFEKGAAADALLVEGRRGQGLKVTPGLNLHYLTRESFTPKEGTIAFWLKPVGSWGDMQCIRYFLAVRADRVTMQFYAYYGTPYFLISTAGRYDLIGGADWARAFEKKPFADEQWIFFAGTYKPGQQTFYLNGQLIICRTDSLIEPEFVNTGTVEIPAGDQVLDEIMIFDRVLTEPEIQALYRANVPDVKRPISGEK